MIIIHTVRSKTPYLILISLLVSLFSPVSSFAQESNASSNEMLETDSIPPIISNVYPEEGKTISENTTYLSASLKDDGSGLKLGSIVFKIDGQVLGNGSIPVNYMHGLAFTYSPELQYGTHTFEIQVEDLAGNIAQHSSVFYVKKSIWPEGSVVQANNNGMYSVSLSWTAAEGSTGYRVYWGQQLLAELDETIRSYEVTDLQAGSYYGFKIEAQHPDGGWTTDGPYVDTETLPLPHFPPTIWAVSPSTGTTVTTANPVIKASIRAAGHGLQTSSILVKVDNQLIPSSYDEKSLTLTASLSGLENGYHNFLIRAADNEGIYRDYNGSFHVQAAWPIVSKLNVDNVSPTSLALSWTPAAGSSGYRIFRDGELIDTVNETIHSYEVKNLAPSTSYTFKVEAKLSDAKWTTDGPSAIVRTGMLPNPILDLLKPLHAALASGDPSDVQDVRKLRDEIAGLNDSTDQSLIDPVWNKIAANLPQTANQAELKSSLFRLIKAIGSVSYDSLASNLDDIRTNPEYRATMKTLAAAGGHTDITMDDLMTFLSGDGGSRKGLEGTIAGILAQKSKLELAQLLLNKQKQTAVLHETLVLLLGDPDAYKLSSILNQLDVTPGDLLAMAQNFRQKLQHDEPAARAITVAYIRSETVETVKITANGKKHNYSLKVHGIELPSAILKWSKVSGDGAVTVRANGAVSIPDQSSKGTAVIQATLVNPYGGKAKVIFQKEVTLVNGDAVL